MNIDPTQFINLPFRVQKQLIRMYFGEIPIQAQLLHRLIEELNEVRIELSCLTERFHNLLAELKDDK